MNLNNQEGASCPIISKDWLEERYGVVAAASIYAEIQRTDKMADKTLEVANDATPTCQVA